MVFENGLIRAIADLDDNEEEQFFMLYFVSARKKRRVKYFHQRINWDEHIEAVTNERDGFGRRYHMTLASFNNLVNLLRPMVAVDEIQSMRSTGGNDPIIPEITVGAGLRFIGGSSKVDLADIYGISVTSAERIIDNFLTAVDHSLQWEIPRTPEALQRCSNDWQKLSTAGGIYQGVIGAIDGWLCFIDTPSVDSPVDYYSGHYMTHGVNVQAICDANLRFLYFSIIAPGRTNDGRVFSRCDRLRDWLDALPEEYFIVGDNAYPCSNSLLTPYTKRDIGNNKDRRTYNYYLCQLRIRIEMAFGRLTTKWRIFRRKLECRSLEKVSLIIQVAGKLHNYVIDNDGVKLPEGEDLEDELEAVSFGVERLEVANGSRGLSESNLGYAPIIHAQRAVPENTQRRELIVEEIVAMDLERPEHNIIRNRDYDEDSVYYVEE